MLNVKYILIHLHHQDQAEQKKTGDWRQRDANQRADDTRAGGDSPPPPASLTQVSRYKIYFFVIRNIFCSKKYFCTIMPLNIL